MKAPRIRIEYDDLGQIAKTFGNHEEATESTSQALNRQAEILRNGHWIGRGADAFYREMDESILPSLKGLARVLGLADRVTRDIDKIMHEAEEDAASLIQLFGVGGMSLGVGAAVSGIAAGAGGAGASPWSGINKLLVQDPGGLFSQSKLRGLIGLQIQGAGAEIGIAMRDFLSNPSKGRATKLIAIIIILRGRPEAEIQVEFEKFQEAMEQRNAAGAEQPDSGGGGGSASHMGSMTQMRYGSVVGDAFGIDPTFGAMLNPNGGLIGPGNWSFAGADTAVGYHKIAHDAAGYLHNYHQVGPGYDYLGTGSGSPSNPASGHSAGIGFWREALGGSTSSSALRSPSTRSEIGGVNRLNQSLTRGANIY
jgi:WXG100 family type VII secretion target